MPRVMCRNSCSFIGNGISLFRQKGPWGFIVRQYLIEAPVRLLSSLNGIRKAKLLLVVIATAETAFLLSHLACAFSVGGVYHHSFCPACDDVFGLSL